MRADNFDLVDLFRKELAAATAFKDTGKDEQMDGTQVRVFTFRLGPFAVTGGGAVSPSRISNESEYIGEGTLYIDPKTRLIHKLVLTQQSSSVGGAFDRGGQPKTFTVTTLYSRHNDAGITLPKP